MPRRCTASGAEIDLLLDRAIERVAVEIRCGRDDDARASERIARTGFASVMQGVP